MAQEGDLPGGARARFVARGAYEEERNPENDLAASPGNLVSSGFTWDLGPWS
jgi:hypothetical protein